MHDTGRNLSNQLQSSFRNFITIVPIAAGGGASPTSFDGNK
jgi:hypothetical protein